MREFPNCNKACAICNESSEHDNRLYCQSALDALHDNGIAPVGMNVRELDGVKHVEVQPWSCAQNCADWNLNESRAARYLPEGCSAYDEHAFDWYFERCNYVK